MKWFKFYGQDFLTDPKMRILTVEEKMCWVVLMCLANSEDKGGLISYINEGEVMHQAGIKEGTPMWEETSGFLEKFQAMKMIKINVTNVTQGSVTNVHKAVQHEVLLINFDTRQETNLTSAERQQRYRNRYKQGFNERNDSNAGSRNDSNARIDKNRIDKINTSRSLRSQELLVKKKP
jgi:hypothetical protein